MILKYFEADNIDINKYNLILFHGDNEGAKKETMEELQSDASLVPYLVEYNFSNIPKGGQKSLVAHQLTRSTRKMKKFTISQIDS